VRCAAGEARGNVGFRRPRGRIEEVTGENLNQIRRSSPRLGEEGSEITGQEPQSKKNQRKLANKGESGGGVLQ